MGTLIGVRPWRRGRQRPLRRAGRQPLARKPHPPQRRNQAHCTVVGLGVVVRCDWVADDVIAQINGVNGCCAQVEPCGPGLRSKMPISTAFLVGRAKAEISKRG
jgi:hypothetical protein